jgi:hypothetical protein
MCCGRLRRALMPAVFLVSALTGSAASVDERGVWAVDAGWLVSVHLEDGEEDWPETYCKQAR